MTGFVLSVDEVRALHRFMDMWLPGFLADGDEADPVVDAAAVRGLAAREFVELDGGVSPKPPLSLVLNAFHQAELAVEITTEHVECAYSRSGAHAAVLEYLPRGLVRCEPVRPGVDEIVTRSGLRAVTGAAAGPRWTVDAEAYLACDELAQSGDEDAAVTALIVAGVAAHTAKAWVAALCARRGAAAITAVRRDVHSGRLSAAELRWLTDESGGAWRITADDIGTVLTPVTPEQLGGALQEICGGEERG